MVLDFVVNRFICEPFESETSSRVVMPGDFLRRRYYPNLDSPNLYVLLPGWHQTFDKQRALREKASGMGSCLEYEWSGEAFSTDYRATAYYLEAIGEGVRADIDELSDGDSYLTLVTNSLGCIPALIAANHNTRVQKLHLIVPGHELAESLWYSIRTQHMREKFEEEGITLDDLVHEWRKIAPINHLDGLRDKQIAVTLSKSDRFIPYNCGKKLVDAMRERGLTPKVYENTVLGHALTVHFAYRKGGCLER